MCILASRPSWERASLGSERRKSKPARWACERARLEREHRIKADPAISYVTQHYQDYDSVLARVDKMSDAKLRELLDSGHAIMAAATKRR